MSQSEINDVLKLLLIRVRVFQWNRDQGRNVEVDCVMTPCVPRVGDRWLVQGDSCEIVTVEWWAEQHVAHAVVYLNPPEED